MGRTEKQITICILGGAMSHPNNGVAALGWSAMKGVLYAFPDARVMISDFALKPEKKLIQINGQQHEIERTLFQFSSRLRWWGGSRHVEWVSRLIRCCPVAIRRWILNKSCTVEQMLRADVVLDVSGGDSFAEIYGERAFEYQAGVKESVLRLGKPLVLLPQTFGPYKTDQAIERVRQILSSSLLIATRDQNGVDDINVSIGCEFTEQILTVPDMAFMLEPIPVDLKDEPFLVKQNGEKIVGLNVSKLLWDDCQQFGITASYHKVIRGVIDWFMANTDVRLALIPHVVAVDWPDVYYDLNKINQAADTGVCCELATEYAKKYPERVACIGGPYGPGESKYLIGQCDFFVGARMHACIGATSQCIATATMAYSKKASAVMGQIGVSHSVVEMRDVDEKTIIQSVSDVYMQREEISKILVKNIPLTIDKVKQFFTHDLRTAVVTQLG